MYTRNPVKDTILFCKAALSNQVAGYVPGLYVSLTRQTGRGKQESAQSAATYFIDCFFDYQKKLDLIYDKTAREFKGVSLDELSWQGFWIHLVHDGPETGLPL